MEDGTFYRDVIESARSALEIAWWWALWTAYDRAFENRSKLKAWVHKSLAPEQPTAFQTAHQRVELAGELFLGSLKPTEFLPPRDWSGGPPDIELSDGTKTYGHEFEVLKSIVGFFSEVPMTWDVREQFWPAHVDSSQVMLASGSSNQASRVVIGTPDKPTFSPKLGEFRPRLAYAIGIGTGKLRRLQYNKELERQALAICNEEGAQILQAERSGHHQVDDYLLVTRVPGPVPGTVFTVLAGLHGPGTRSAEILFKTISPRDLEDLASIIDHHRSTVTYFQAVFRASQFKEINGSSVATRLELVTEGCPPKRLVA